MGPALEFMFDEGLSKGLDVVGKGLEIELSVPYVLYKGINAIASEFQERMCEDAKKVLKCIHLDICKGWGPPSALMIEYAYHKKGCAFLYRGVPLWHPQFNFKVGAHMQAIRYERGTRKVGYYAMPLKPCLLCEMSN